MGKLIALSIFCLSFGACNNSDRNNKGDAREDSIPKKVEISAANMAGNFSRQTTMKMDSTLLDSFYIYYPLLKSSEKNLRKFYSGRNYALAWHDSAGLIEQAASLYNRMQNLQGEGVSGKIPYLENMDSLMSSEDIKDRKQTVNSDLLLTGMYFYFADKVWGGLSESKLREVDWFLPRKQLDTQGWLDSLLNGSATSSRPNEPVYRQYNLLKNALVKYNEMAAKNAWQPIVFDKKAYKPGDSAELISKIKERLFLLGDLPSQSATNLFDSNLVYGIRKYQHRFGMKEDGIIGTQMINELNVPIQKRIQQIIVNIERSRWLPDQVKGDYLAVNIPEFRLHVYRDDSLLWDANVVVGQAVNKTVIFSSNVKYVVFSPYWNVPPGILRKEVLPGIRRNKNYLASHHMEMNGKSVRQKPGPWNSLGQVKFLFPNSYNIYLHDTPSKSLFSEDQRAFSHGCIRVSNPKKLALFLLRNDPAWDENKITQAMNSGKEKYVTLNQTIPVFIAYFTAWVDREGKLNFRKDIYNRDERLAKMISE